MGILVKAVLSAALLVTTSIGAFAVERASFQPDVQFLAPGVESGDVVSRAQRDGGGKAARFCIRRFRYFCQSGFFFIRAFSLGPAGGGLSSARTKASYCSVSST